MELTRRHFLASATAAAASSLSPLTAAEKRPNVVVIFLDDSGWSDFHPFGDPPYPTPNVQRLASEGCRYTNFYVPQAICSASRAALLSGCNPCRTKVVGAHGPNERGLDPKYATMGEMLQKSGYRTAVFGKWHIGDQPETRPWARGFDESCGLMYSNDMWEFHPENPKYWGQYPLRFWENGKIKIDRVTPEHQPMLTTWYTEHAVDFIKRSTSEKKPFFLYLPHSMPHVPLFVSDKFKGKSGKGLFADVQMEIDWSVGEVMKALREGGVEKDTIVMFTSDNGPWISYGNHAGHTPFREAKGTSFDGGTRSACIVRYPGKIKAGSVSDRAWCTIDILPTIAHLTGAKLPDNPIDGRNVWDLIRGAKGATNPHEYYAFSIRNNFEAVMTGDGRWKMHLPHQYQKLVKAGMDGAAGKYEQRPIEMSLFDLAADRTESTNVAARYPEVAARLQAIADRHRAEFYQGK
jgi:arylsulfatase A-like enzyme